MPDEAQRNWLVESRRRRDGGPYALGFSRSFCPGSRANRGRVYPLFAFADHAFITLEFYGRSSLTPFS
jgi:hypothetical protein